MSLKELWQYFHEQLEEEMGREPTHDEVRDAYLSHADSICDAYKDES